MTTPIQISKPSIGIQRLFSSEHLPQLERAHIRSSILPLQLPSYVGDLVLETLDRVGRVEEDETDEKGDKDAERGFGVDTRQAIHLDKQVLNTYSELFRSAAS